MCPAWCGCQGGCQDRDGNGSRHQHWGLTGCCWSQVADCVCLLALDKAEAVPVDTHVWHIARQRYGVALGGKSLTPRAYQEIGEGRAGSYVAPSGMVDGASVPPHWCSPSLHRRLLPGPVGPSSWLGAGSEYPPSWHPCPLLQPCPPHYLPPPGPVLCRPPQGPEASQQLASGVGDLRLGQLWGWAL